MADFSDVEAVFPLKAYTIVGIDTGTEELVVDGDQTARILVNDTLRVIESTGNDGLYTVASRTYDSGDDETTIVINEDITDATVDGTILHDEISDFLAATQAHDDVADRDAATPDQFAGAHKRRFANEIRALGRTVGIALGGEVIDAGGLDIYHSSGQLIFGSGTPIDIPLNKLTVADNDDSYIEVNSSGVVSSNVVGFSNGQYPLAIVTAASGDITRIQDKRGALYLAEFTEANLDDLAASLFDPATELTISGGTVTRTQNVHRIDTEGDSPSDNLDTISGGADGMLIIVRAQDAARTVVLKDGTGNLALNGADIALDDTDPWIFLQYDGVLSKWVIIGTTGDLKADGSVDVQNLVLEAASELTIATGAVTRTQLVHTIDTEGDVPSDNLDTISGGTDGMLVILRAENAARTVVLRDDIGNLALNGQDITLDNVEPFIFLQYDGVLSAWVPIGPDISKLLNKDGSVDVENLVFEAAAELTISGGIVTRTQAVHSIDTEGDSPSDDLVTINGGADGMIVLVRAENAARTVILKETGNLALGGSDITLDAIDKMVLLYYEGAVSKWLLIGGGGAVAAAGEPVTLELGHGEFPTGLTNEEIHRFQLQAGEVFTLTRLELQIKGGGSPANVSLNVYDSTGASQIDTVNAGSVSVTGGASGAASLILVRITNTSGGQVIATPIVRGSIA